MEIFIAIVLSSIFGLLLLQGANKNKPNIEIKVVPRAKPKN